MPYKIQELIEASKKKGGINTLMIPISSDTLAFASKSKVETGKIMVKFEFVQDEMRSSLIN